MTPEEFRTLGHALVDWIVEHRQRIETLPVKALVSPGQVSEKIPTSPPTDPVRLDNMLTEIDATIVPGLLQWMHPQFFGYFPGNAHLSSVLADMLATGLGVNVFSWETSPAATELEERMVDWMRQMVDLPPSFEGTIYDTASTGSLVAMLCAREQASGFAMQRGGLAELSQKLCVYASEEAHSSVKKAALLAGFGESNLRWIQTDKTYAMRTEDLAAHIERDVAAGFKPAAIVATSGTTSTTAFDPLMPIAKLAKHYGLWLHVDAAMAGSAMILPEMRPLWQGVAAADSLLFNPHKWLGAALDLSLYYTSRSDVLRAVMGTNPAYLQSQSDKVVKNYRDWGIPLGRRFRALKLWFLLMDEGVQGLQKRLRRDIENARWLAEEISKSRDWEVVAPVQLQTVCVRHCPQGLSEQALNAHNQKWPSELNASGKAYLTTTIVRGQRVVRVSVGSEKTERPHVAQLWEWMQAFARLK